MQYNHTQFNHTHATKGDSSCALRRPCLCSDSAAEFHARQFRYYVEFRLSSPHPVSFVHLDVDAEISDACEASVGEKQTRNVGRRRVIYLVLLLLLSLLLLLLQ